MAMNYFNSSDISSQLIPRTLNSEQATTFIIERAKRLVNQLVEDRGHDKPPFLSEEFARLLGYQVVKAELGETSGLLLKFHDGFVIKVNQKHNLTRQNFSCAHEIGHAIFGELKLRRYIRSIEYRTFNPEGERGARTRAIERLCNVAATELLMPEFVFRKYLSNFGLSISSIEHLANVFRVSIQSTAIRIAELSPDPCMTLLWQLWPRNKPKGLRLAWCAGPGRDSRGKAKYMPTHILVKYPSKLHKAYEYYSPVKSWKLFKVDNGVKRLPMESKGFGRGETRYVISLAFPDR